MSPYQISLNVCNQNHCIKMTCKYLKILPSIYDFGVKKNIQEFYCCCAISCDRAMLEKIVKCWAIHYQTLIVDSILQTI